METDITLTATGSMLLRFAIIAAFGWILYRVLRRRPASVRNDGQSYYAAERLRNTRHQR